MAASVQLDHGNSAAALREGRAPVRDRLTAMLFLMALLHAIVILGLTFSGSGGIQAGNAPQLDVLLVTNEVPEAKLNNQARYLAQRTQIGAGNTSAPLSVTSPGSRGAAASEQHASTGGGAGNDSEQRDLRVLISTAASRDIRYVGEAHAASAATSPQFVGSTEGEPRSGRGDAAELLLTGKANPGHWVTPDTRASELAPYLAAWKLKVERVGTLNFPSAARRSGLTGSPVLEVDIDANGHLKQVRVRRSSGFGALDEAALAILKLASPFDPLPTSLAADYSQLRLAYQWDFVAGTLQTSAVTSSADTPSRP